MIWLWLCLHPSVAAPVERPVLPLPARAADAPDGPTFANSMLEVDDHDRYAASAAQVLAGNVPDSLRRLVPVTLSAPPHTATVWVSWDYVSVGTDAEPLRVAFDRYTAARVAKSLDCILPTSKLVDAIYAQASVHLAPEPLAPSDQMRTVQARLEHRERVEAHLGPRDVGVLLSGHKKDIVLTNQLRAQPDRVAIYGWHTAVGTPIQPVSLWHGAMYADYSHGLRLVHDRVQVDGKWRSLAEVLADPELAPLFSDEGPVEDPWSLLPLSPP